MKGMMAGLALLALAGCESTTPGGYAEMPEHRSAIGAGPMIPQPPQAPQPPIARPPGGGPPPGYMPQVIQPPAPPPFRASCSAPSIPIRTEASGAIELKCGAPPTAAPAGMTCTAPEQLTFLTRNGVASFQCMR